MFTSIVKRLIIRRPTADDLADIMAGFVEAKHQSAGRDFLKQLLKGCQSKADHKHFDVLRDLLKSFSKISDDPLAMDSRISLRPIIEFEAQLICLLWRDREKQSQILIDQRVMNGTFSTISLDLDSMDQGPRNRGAIWFGVLPLFIQACFLYEDNERLEAFFESLPTLIYTALQNNEFEEFQAFSARFTVLLDHIGDTANSAFPARPVIGLYNSEFISRQQNIFRRFFTAMASLLTLFPEIADEKDKRFKNLQVFLNLLRSSAHDLNMPDAAIDLLIAEYRYAKEHRWIWNTLIRQLSVDLITIARKNNEVAYKTVLELWANTFLDSGLNAYAWFEIYRSFAAIRTLSNASTFLEMQVHVCASLMPTALPRISQEFQPRVLANFLVLFLLAFETNRMLLSADLEIIRTFAITQNGAEIRKIIHDYLAFVTPYGFQISNETLEEYFSYLRISAV